MWKTHKSYVGIREMGVRTMRREERVCALLENLILKEYHKQLTCWAYT